MSEAAAVDPREALRARIAAAQAAKARVDAQRAEETVADLEGAALRAERDLADAEALTQAECEHGRVGGKIAAVSTDVGLVILKRPHPVTFQKFQDEGDFKTQAVRKLVESCRIYPDASRFGDMIDAQPGILTACGDAAATLAGVRRAELSGKSTS